MRITLFLFLALTLAGLGCEHSTSPSDLTIALRTVQGAVLPFDPFYRGTPISARVTNYTSDTVEVFVCQETPFILEVYRDGEWRHALPDPFDCLPWTITIPPGSTHDGTYTLLHTGWLQTGLYRLTAGVFPAGGREFIRVASNPFTLVVERAPDPSP
jgi:hypothetical protein